MYVTPVKKFNRHGYKSQDLVLIVTSQVNSAVIVYFCNAVLLMVRSSRVVNSHVRCIDSVDA